MNQQVVINDSSLKAYLDAFGKYLAVTRKSRIDAAAHSAKGFSIKLHEGIRSRKHTPGEITRERMAEIKTRGLRIGERARRLVYARLGISQDVSGASRYYRTARRKGKVSLKRVNPLRLQRQLVAQELRLRESAAGFTTASALLRGNFKSRAVSASKGTQLGESSVVGESAVEIAWGRIGFWSKAAATGLTSDRARGIFNTALTKQAADHLEYVSKKNAEKLAEVKP